MKSQLFLKSPLDFKRVLNTEEVFYGRYFIVKRAPNDLSFCRFGLIVSKKVGGAVIRNHVKRLGREVMRTKQLIGSSDIVLIAKRNSAEADLGSISTDISRLLGRAGLS